MAKVACSVTIRTEMLHLLIHSAVYVIAYIENWWSSWCQLWIDGHHDANFDVGYVLSDWYLQLSDIPLFCILQKSS